MEKTLKEFESSANKLVQEFAKKHNLELSFFMDNNCTGPVCFNVDAYYFNLRDIYFDLKTNQPKDRITDWHEKTIEEKSISYEMYCVKLDKK